MHPSQFLLDETNRLISAADDQTILLRVLGGLAIKIHRNGDHPLFTREYGDLDFVVTGKHRRAFENFMPSAGYSPHKQFNLLNGTTRQIYYHDATGMKVDIFVGSFAMCHRIPLEDRLHLHPLTIPPADLLLTKAQIAELNRKDALDIASLLLDVETGSSDEAMINLDRIAELCGNDWGLYKTTSINLKRVKEIVGEESLALAESERSQIEKRIGEILSVFESMPKSVQWKMRDKVGTRVRWYEEVEEVAR
ncbi:MAG TPA: nucleotidyltransferase family protein [Anaerolineales bacterium]|nr:nucleotidyltransferase family protein [Anaerolineales bacterium]HMR98364.1 nucleotidyltransferase family protein [Anaerolineales bacterium]HNQ94955.1 nucleotidyltransferase family protein [Anaerolineales bacterium]HNS61829.1 nucleotidyltransferase family protein [Anaerolineales bacterium]